MLLVDVSLLYLLFIVVRRLVATIALFCSIRLFICTTFFHPSFRLVKKWKETTSRLPTYQISDIRYQTTGNKQQATGTQQQSGKQSNQRETRQSKGTRSNQVSYQSKVKILTYLALYWIKFGDISSTTELNRLQWFYHNKQNEHGESVDMLCFIRHGQWWEWMYWMNKFSAGVAELRSIGQVLYPCKWRNCFSWHLASKCNCHFACSLEPSC